MSLRVSRSQRANWLACAVVFAVGILAGCSDEGYVVPGANVTCGKEPNPLLTRAGKDTYDCLFLDRAAFYHEPDPMILKAQADLESAFDPMAVSMDSPC